MDKEVVQQCRSFLLLFHIFLSAFNFSLIITAICGRTWLYSFNEVGLYYDHEWRIGLWQNCFTLYDYGCPTESCTHSGSNVADYVQATRSFLILATLPALFAFIGSIIMVLSERMKGIPSAICHLITAGFVFIAMVAYSAKLVDVDTEDVWTFGWTFIVGWLTLPLLILAFFIAMIHGGEHKLPRIIIEYRH